MALRLQLVKCPEGQEQKMECVVGTLVNSKQPDAVAVQCKPTSMFLLELPSSRTALCL